MARLRLLAAAVVMLTMLGPTQSLAPLEALAQCNFTPGSVVSLVGTPHLFINDNAGVLLHWGGDTRALAGKTIQWGNQCNLGLDPLKATPRGDPWLSAGLPQVGEVIYQAKWEQDEAQPTLLRIRRISDVELFGIGESNYGTFVLGRSTWEQQYGFQVGNLQVGPLASADSYAWSSTDQANYAQLLTNMKGVESAALFQATQAGIDAGTSLPAIANCEERGLVQFDNTRNPSTSLQVTQDCLTQLGGAASGAPAAPTNLRLSSPGAPGVVRLDWNDTSNNETGFQVQRNGVVIGTVSANVTTYTDSAAPSGGQVCYLVAAFNAAGQTPGTSVCVGAITPPGPPNPPTNLRLSAGANNGMRLDWTDTSNNEDGFRIERSNQPIATLPPNVTTYTDFGWNPAVQNCYQVIAFNEFGAAPSAVVCPGTSGAPGAPSAPTGLRTTPMGNSVRLDWTDTSNNEDGFRIERGDQPITTVGPNVTTFTDLGASPTGPNCYQVFAFNEFGSVPSAEVCTGGSQGNVTAPTAPTGLRLTPAQGNTSMRLDWTDTSTNEDGFRIERGGQIISTVAPNVTTFVDATWNTSVSGCYRVIAFNALGSTPSAQQCPVQVNPL